MSRLQQMAMRWAGIPVPGSVPQARCGVCQYRYLSSSSSRRIDERGGQTEDDATSPSTKSAMDQIFDGPDAFYRDEPTSTNISRKEQSRAVSSKTSQTLSRAVLGGIFEGDEYTSQLNQEWDDSGRKFDRHTRSSPDSSAPFFKSMTSGVMKNRKGLQRSRTNGWSGKMTPSEAKIFEDVFHNIFSSDGKQDSTLDVLDDDGLFGSTLTNGSNENLNDFRDRAMMKKLRSSKLKADQKRRGLAALLTEGMNAEDVNEEEMVAKIDQAKEEIVACQTVADTWQWAAKNVWGEDRELHMVAEAKRVEEAIKQEVIREMEAVEAKEAREAGANDTAEEVEASSSGSSSSNDDTTENANLRDEGRPDDLKTGAELEKTKDIPAPRFGMSTPYYAPVLSLLLVEMRERFKSPQSALSILRIAKDLGPESFVLGCTPRLYAQALRTRWMILKDLQGSRDTLQEARVTGILGTRNTLTEAWNERGTTRHGMDPNDLEEESVRNIVTRSIKNEVRQHVLEGMKRLPDGQSSQAYKYQLKLVSEMNEMTYSKVKPTVKRYRQQQPRGRLELEI